MLHRKIPAFFISPIFALSILSFLLAGIFWLLSPSPSSQQLSVRIPTPTTIATPTIKNINTPINTIIPTTIPTRIPTIQPTSTPIPQPTIIPTNIQTINLEVYEPDGNKAFSLPYSSGSNPCSLLNKAKTEEKIHSVTIIHYDAPLNSDYVKEINGYSDNWTFAINGSTQPKGCSNYPLTSEDTVRWTYK